jgi:DNA-binding protein HU-beta
MNRSELIEAVAKRNETTNVNASKAVEAVLQIIAISLKRGDAVEIKGFGKFFVAKRKARMGRNPRTATPLKIPSAFVPRFTAGKTLRDVTNSRGS